MQHLYEKLRADTLKGIDLKYLFVKQQTWDRINGNSIAELIATIEQNLFSEGENNI